MDFDFSEYSTEDFVLDPSFRKWVKNPDVKNNEFWKAWMSKYPEKNGIISQARQIIMLLDIKENQPAEGKFLEIWEKIILDNKEDENIIPLTPPKVVQTKQLNKKNLFYLKYAAALIGFLFISTFLYKLLILDNYTIYTTAFGETKDIVLPDGSKVILNGNSTIKYANVWRSEENRVVELDGEAFFSVTHKENKQKFLVETKDLNVEVLGTEFNVLSRKSRAVVVLNSGKVKLDIKDNINSLINGGIIMEPGEMIEYNLEVSRLEKGNVDPEIYSSWKNNVLVFKSTTVAEIAQLLDESHGLKIIIEDKELAKEKFTGSFPTGENIDILLNMLSKTFKFKIIYAENNKIIFQAKN